MAEPDKIALELAEQWVTATKVVEFRGKSLVRSIKESGLINDTLWNHCKENDIDFSLLIEKTKSKI